MNIFLKSKLLPLLTEIGLTGLVAA